MWHWSRKPTHVAIDRDCVTVFETNGKASSAQAIRSYAVCGLPSVADAIHSCLSSIKPAASSVRILVSDYYARFWIAQPPAEATTKSDLSASARWRFEDLFGEPPLVWNIEADWNARRPFMACALPNLLTDAIATTSAACRIGVTSCLPRFIAEWNTHHRRLRKYDSVWLAVLADSTVTIALVRGKEIAQIQQVRCLPTNGVDLDALTASLRGMALQAEHACPSTVMLCGDVPEQWHEAQNKEYRFELAVHTALASRIGGLAIIEQFREQAQ